MSFSTTVKDELSRHQSKARHCRMAELGAILSIGARISDSLDTLEILSDHRALVYKTEELLRDLFHIVPEVSRRCGRGGSRVRGYCLRLRDPQKIRRIFTELGMLETNMLMPDQRLTRSCCRRAYLRGAFLAGGSINDPTKNYHIEILAGSPEQAGRLVSFFADFDVQCRLLSRSRAGSRRITHVVYLKDADQIVDVLRIIKAPLALMELENVRVEKDVINHVQRQVNCEAANISKIVGASLKQTEAIRYLMEQGAYARLPQELKDIAEIRLSFPDMGLKEMGTLLDPAISKSGVNHRLKKIEKIAQELKQSRAEDENAHG
ncbi:MAG: DNA-binding protein WhiA [Firmicutes bacterium]|nr:DNA-binding protein WhiA [Bacillota bacterium]